MSTALDAEFEAIFANDDEEYGVSPEPDSSAADASPQLVCRRCDGPYGRDEFFKGAVPDRLATVAIESGVGAATVTVRRADTDEGEHSGVILDLQFETGSSYYSPYAELLPDGVRIHLGGAIESEAILDALRAALDLMHLHP